jgi:hypothetical protein
MNRKLRRVMNATILRAAVAVTGLFAVPAAATAASISHPTPPAARFASEATAFQDKVIEGVLAPTHNGRHLPAVTRRLLSYGEFSFESITDLNAGYERCIGISGTTAGAWNCTYVNDQLWHEGGEIDGSSGYYQFVNAKGQCLGVAGGSDQREAAIVGWTCLGTTHPDQYWGVITSQQGSVWTLINWNSGYAIDLKNGNINNGAPLWQYTWIGGNPNQQWSFVPTSP